MKWIYLSVLLAGAGVTVLGAHLVAPNVDPVYALCGYFFWFSLSYLWTAR